jgi:hypothetical protein
MDKSGANYAGLANINLLLIVSESELLQQWLAHNG